jgi:hypothetical protein
MYRYLYVMKIAALLAVTLRSPHELFTEIQCGTSLLIENSRTYTETDAGKHHLGGNTG